MRKYIEGYLAALGVADAVIFDGGIGEHAPDIRARMCGEDWCGLVGDRDLDDMTVALPAGSAARISWDRANVEAYVVVADEEA